MTCEGDWREDDWREGDLNHPHASGIMTREGDSIEGDSSMTQSWCGLL
jgi:hypothetical protein